jgi:hypothetical protein
MGQQYVETIGMYGPKVNKEWPSEFQCYFTEEMKSELLDMIFNRQYGIYYYEPANKEEADEMIRKFKLKIRELEERWVR